MAALDVNKDGTCSFEEFKKFWSSKPGLGGYSGTALTFLKMKLSAGAMLNKGRKLISKAGSFIGAGESTEDTLVDWHSEVTPVGKELRENMSVTFEIKQASAATKHLPMFSLRLV